MIVMSPFLREKEYEVEWVGGLGGHCSSWDMGKKMIKLILLSF